MGRFAITWYAIYYSLHCQLRILTRVYCHCLAYGELDGYGCSLKHIREDCLSMWGGPSTQEEVYDLFAKYCRGELSALPWSDLPLCPESDVIREKLAAINLLGFLTINSQPAVDGIASSDHVYGWGPKNGYVYQKAYLEFFVSPEDLQLLTQHIVEYPFLTYYAVNKKVNATFCC